MNRSKLTIVRLLFSNLLYCSDLKGHDASFVMCDFSAVMIVSIPSMMASGISASAIMNKSVEVNDERLIFYELYTVLL